MRSIVIDQVQTVTKPHSSYRHEAFLWRDLDDFLAGTVPFIKDGLAAEEPVMVAVIEPRAAMIREALGKDDADRVMFVDMAELGRNPAKIIPAWREFLDAESSAGRPLRGIGEPIWAGRRPEEILECQLHEALLNIAVDPDTPFWLVCPYDTGGLPPVVIEEAHRSHPAIFDADGYRGSAAYAGRPHIDVIFATELPPLAGPFEEITFTADDTQGLSMFVAVRAHAAGLTAEKAAALAVAVHELAQSSLHRGSASGVVRISCQQHAVICDVQDETRISDPLTGRRPTAADQRKGLAFANQVCDLVQLRSTSTGTTVRVHHWI
ncbi:MAG TPA: MEDS domain-containing protein [Propionibacteriaceae bacterium]|nr:MEDS domain-containing protein [Propionibacteriaceae bacterium]